MLKQVIDFLEQKPGYAKEGGERLAKIMNDRGFEVNPELCREGIRTFLIKKRNAERKKNTYRVPRILVLDIETTPLEAYVWQMNVWRANINDDAVISKWFMLTWSAKWLFDSNVMSMRLNGKEVYNEDDGRIVWPLWELLNEADIVIAHNGDIFDVPNINTRFIVHGLPPTTPYQTIDTLKVARKQFGFSHNSLNALAKVFGFDPKIETNFNLWKRCKNGEEAALIEMETYNRHDVELLEEVYVKVRPWIKSHPNLGLYMEATQEVCPNCGSTHLEHIGNYYTQVGRYDALRCECGAIVRRRANNLPKEMKENLTISIAR